MCGIVAGISHQQVLDALLTGLQRLEYRGYDSCGLAFIEENTLQRSRTTQRVEDLKTQVNIKTANIGIAHTRWATHGKPTTDNAHPHFSNEQIALVHNGIIENYASIRDKLIAKGYLFTSQTDTEAIAHLLHFHYQTTPNLLEALRLTTLELKGAYAIAAFHVDEPNIIVGAKLASPLVLSIGENEHFLVSDTLAISGRCNQAIYLQDGQLVQLTQNAYQIINQEGQVQSHMPVHNIMHQFEDVNLGPYQHYMQKEIFEQPKAISDTLSQLLELDGFDCALFGETKDVENTFKQIEQILIIACGTSYYAGLTAKYWLEEIANIQTNIEIASEYRYRQSVANPKQLIICISQSGETADTLAALEHAKKLGHTHTLGICNVASSALIRQTKLHLLTKAGVEIGVASTKAFTTQLVALAILTFTLAKVRQGLSVEFEQTILAQLKHLPNAVSHVLALEPSIQAWSQAFIHKEHALFLGRGMHFAIALEGALKLKEISYIHAEAYAAGELKHGPLALVTSAMPVVVVAPNNALLEKLQSNMHEVKARGGELFVFGDEDSHLSHEDGAHLIRLPAYANYFSPIIHVVALQLFAYHTALIKGNDVDKPRNLAKSVTVE